MDRRKTNGPHARGPSERNSPKGSTLPAQRSTARDDARESRPDRVVCLRRDRREVEFARFATRKEADTCAARLCLLACPAEVREVVA
jgi:hypothetical protein